MTTENQTTDAGTAERKRAPASNFLPIVRGRLPQIFVHAVRFDAVIAKMSTKDAAAKFGTSVGKVFDIRKGRNFSYIGADWKPTGEDVGAAEAWIGQVGGENAKGLTAVGDTQLMQMVLDQYKARGLATAEEVAAQSAARAPARKPKAEGSAPAQASEKVQAGDAAESLLS